MTRRQLAVFAAALVAVPVVSAVIVVTTVAGATGGRGTLAALALLGVALGAVLVALGRRYQRGDLRRLDLLALTVVAVAVALGPVSDGARMLDAVMAGAVLGFFIALAVVIVRLWRRDAHFRDRITAAWR